MRKILSMIFFIAGGLSIAAAGLYGCFLSFQVVFSVFPAWFAYLSFLFFPFVYGIAPFYAGLAYGDWTLFFISYLGVIPGGILFYLGSIISEDK